MKLEIIIIISKAVVVQAALTETEEEATVSLTGTENIIQTDQINQTITIKAIETAEQATAIVIKAAIATIETNTTEVAAEQATATIRTIEINETAELPETIGALETSARADTTAETTARIETETAEAAAAEVEVERKNISRKHRH